MAGLPIPGSSTFRSILLALRVPVIPRPKGKHAGKSSRGCSPTRQGLYYSASRHLAYVQHTWLTYSSSIVSSWPASRSHAHNSDSLWATFTFSILDLASSIPTQRLKNHSISSKRPSLGRQMLKLYSVKATSTCFRPSSADPISRQHVSGFPSSVGCPVSRRHNPNSCSVFFLSWFCGPRLASQIPRQRFQHSSASCATHPSRYRTPR